MSKRILVTGADGQLGREMQRVAKGSSDRYIFTDLAELDITDYEAIIRVVIDNSVDVIVNCAAYTNVDRAEDDEANADLLNNIAVGYLANAARNLGAILIHISTDYVFDGESRIPYTEGDKTSPIGVYGQTKLAGERRVQESGCTYIIIRSSWLYSKWGGNFVKTILRLSAERDSLEVVADQVGSPTYAEDLADAIGGIISRDMLDRRGIYHYSNEGESSWYEFAKAICSMSSRGCDIRPIESSEFPSRAKRPHYSVLDKSKFKASFEIEIPHWRESLERFITEIRDKI
ncbi:MAG: dTDP-4-dehydrorhamnose reductase [Rikenellaceae bacterium]